MDCLVGHLSHETGEYNYTALHSIVLIQLIVIIDTINGSEILVYHALLHNIRIQSSTVTVHCLNLKMYISSVSQFTDKSPVTLKAFIHLECGARLQLALSLV